MAGNRKLCALASGVDDLAAILDSLGAGPIDLYGDSYGTFFEQVFGRGDAQAELQLAGPGDLRGTLQIKWTGGLAAASAEIRGELPGGAQVHARSAVP